MDARVGIGELRKRIDVDGFELGEMAEFEHEAREFMLFRELFKDVLRGRDGFAFAACGGCGQAHVCEEHYAELLWRIDVEGFAGKLKNAGAGSFHFGREARGEAV